MTKRESKTEPTWTDVKAKPLVTALATTWTTFVLSAPSSPT